MRIAKNETVHAIWLKLSEMLRFIVSSLFSLSRVRLDGAVRKALQSVKICMFAEIADSYAPHG